MKKTFILLTGVAGFLLLSFSAGAQQVEAKAETIKQQNKASDKIKDPVSNPQMTAIPKPLVMPADKGASAQVVPNPGPKMNNANVQFQAQKPGTQNSKNIKTIERPKTSTLLPVQDNKSAKPTPKPVVAKPED